MPANLENSAVAKNWKRSVFIPIPKKGNAKECSNYCTIALNSHASKLKLTILQTRLQKYMNCEFQMFKLVLEKAEETEIKLPTSVDIHRKSKRAREKHLLYWLRQSLWLCESQQTGKFLKRWEYQTTLPTSWEICVQVEK